MEVRNDGYYGAFVKNGIQQYVNNNSYYEEKADDSTLTLMYRNALVRKIITAPIDDCVKNWMHIEGDDEGKVVEYLEELDTERVFVEAGYWDRLYGRAAILMVVDDGKEITEEIDYKNIKRIVALEVFDKREIWQDNTRSLLNDDPNDPNFGKPEYYQITPANCNPFWVHHSRLLLFNGDTLPRSERIANNGAGLSCIDGVITAIRRSDTAQARAYDIIERLSTCVLKLDGLSQILQTEEGTKIVQERLNLIDMARNLLNTIAVDKEDEFQIHNMMIGGIQGMVQEFEQYISGLTSIPVTILFGRSPGGMNSTGAADFENYYNLVRRYQKTKMKPALEKLVKVVMLAKEGPFEGKELESWKIKFNELHALTEQEELGVEKQKIDNQTAEVNLIKLLIELQTMDNDQARKELLKREYPVSKHKIEPPQDPMGGGMPPMGQQPQKEQPKEEQPKEEEK